MIQLGDQIKKLRLRDGLSQEELANRLFISRQAISKWEKGDTMPDLDHIVQLSELFDVSLDYLILAKETQEHQEDDDFLECHHSTTVWEFLENNWWLLPALIPWLILLKELLF